MRIYIDGMWFRHTGIGRIYENLLLGLIESGEVSRIFTIVPRLREAEFRQAFPSDKLEPLFVDLPFNYRELFIKGFAIRRFRHSPDLYYFPSFNVPYFLKGKIISTVCDIIPLSPYFDLPWYAEVRFRYAIRRAAGVSTKVVCISEFTRRQVVDEFRVPHESLEVIYPPVDVRIVLLEAAKAERPLVEGQYLLYVGNRHVHKNLRCLFEAFRILLPEFPVLKVVVAGARMREWDDVDAALADGRLRDHVVVFPSASDADIRNLYAHAQVFVFPSLIEGFGIPPLEAIGHGVPVVCSDIPVTREACGDAAEYADPRDPVGFAQAIRGLLTNPTGRDRQTKGKERIRLFTRERIVAQYLRLFRSCLEGGR